MMTITAAKEAVRIDDLWSRYGFDGSPTRSCRSPFRDERNASFSVFAGGCAWRDFGTGECGDTVTFIERAEGVSNAEACKKIIAYAGGDSARPTPPRITRKKKRGKPALPTLCDSKNHHAKLADLRNVSPQAVDICVERGLLRFGEWKGQPAWFVTDKTGRNAQARRLDGKLWSEIAAKAWTLPKSEASWPIGLEESLPYPIILLVEGGPDLLAAAHFAWCEDRGNDTAFVAMLGASQRLKSDALTALSGKRVRIFSHDDKSGYSSTQRWANQLRNVEAVVDAISFDGLIQTDGSDVGDLNDLCNVHADVFEKHEEIQNLVP